MSPVPLIQLQRRLTEAGRIRMGEKTDTGAPKRLSTWRITSPNQDLIREAAGLYGGEPKPWTSPVGDEWEVITTTAELPVLLMPGYSLSQTYELWTGPTRCDRRCDGITEHFTDKPCLCNDEGDDKCELRTRLTVALPELTTLLGWRVETKGENAARELRGGMDLAEAIAQGSQFIPARLRLTERRSSVNGQAVRFVVPVIDLAVSYQALAAGVGDSRRALPAGYTPLTGHTENGPGVGEALELTAAGAQPGARTARSAAPLGPVADFASDQPLPVDENIEFGAATPSGGAVQEGAGGPAVAAATGTDGPAPSATKAQKKKLDVLVGNLRDRRKALTTEQLWHAMDRVPELGEDGQPHWSTLREQLSKDEAHELIDRLERCEETLGAAT